MKILQYGLVIFSCIFLTQISDASPGKTKGPVARLKVERGQRVFDIADPNAVCARMGADITSAAEDYEAAETRLKNFALENSDLLKKCRAPIDSKWRALRKQQMAASSSAEKTCMAPFLSKIDTLMTSTANCTYRDEFLAATQRIMSAAGDLVSAASKEDIVGTISAGIRLKNAIDELNRVREKMSSCSASLSSLTAEMKTSCQAAAHSTRDSFLSGFLALETENAQCSKEYQDRANAPGSLALRQASSAAYSELQQAQSNLRNSWLCDRKGKTKKTKIPDYSDAELERLQAIR